MNPPQMDSDTPANQPQIDGNQDQITPPSEVPVSTEIAPKETSQEDGNQMSQKGGQEPSQKDGNEVGLVLTLEKKEGESVMSFCVGCAPKVGEAMEYFQELFKEQGEQKDEVEQVSKRVKTMEKEINYLLGQGETFVLLEEMAKFRDFIGEKFEEVEQDIMLLKKMVASTGKSRASPMDQWTHLVAEMETTPKKRRK